MLCSLPVRSETLATHSGSSQTGNNKLTAMYCTGIAVRSGHHCTQPLHQQLSIGASSRASLYVYNTAAEVDKFIESLESTIKIFD